MSDPTWLPEVLRAEGLRCDIFPGAMDRGHGDFGSIWGVICHHTGSFGETPNGIANHPSLGLASQLYLSKDGVYTLCGVGIAWHAGEGSWPGIPTNNANQCTIGIEAANDGVSGWSTAQYDAYVRGVAAILRRLGKDSSHAIGHKEWAAIQGKWDPGKIDMPTFRRDVQAVIDRKPYERLENQIDKVAGGSPWLGKRITTGELKTPDGVGRYAQFEQGYVYWSPATGAFPIPTNLFQAWASFKWEAGMLGYPVRFHTVLKGADGQPVGDVQAFQGGVLYRKYGQPGYMVGGAIGKRWAAEGYEAGQFGWPISNEYDRDGGKAQDFEHDTLAWRADGVVKVAA